jgi:hypothetical protein
VTSFIKSLRESMTNLYSILIKLICGSQMKK